MALRLTSSDASEVIELRRRARIGPDPFCGTAIRRESKESVMLRITSTEVNKHERADRVGRCELVRIKPGGAEAVESGTDLASKTKAAKDEGGSVLRPGLPCRVAT